MTTIISDAGVQFAGGNIVDVRSTVPTSGTYTVGDFVLESTTSVKVTGWKRLTTGTGHVLNTDWVYVGGMTLGTAVATTSGTSHDFTGIPSWVKRITVLINEISTSGTSLPQIQLGDSGGVENTGYISAGVNLFNTGSVQGTNSTTGIALTGAVIAATVMSGSVTFTLVSGNSWVASGCGGTSSSGAAWSCGGSKTLSSTLDRIRLTTVNGTDTFDAGSINILYE